MHGDILQYMRSVFGLNDVDLLYRVDLSVLCVNVMEAMCSGRDIRTTIRSTIVVGVAGICKKVMGPRAQLLSTYFLKPRVGLCPNCWLQIGLLPISVLG